MVKTASPSPKPPGHEGRSPHTRGWSPGVGRRSVTPAAVPAHAGVVPLGQGRHVHSDGGPRTRGGGPRYITVTAAGLWRSPHTRGWSRLADLPGHVAVAVPAHAGVVPGSAPASPCRSSGPRTRGGGPAAGTGRRRRRRRSPHTRGWSPEQPVCPVGAAAVPAHAGVVQTRPLRKPESKCGPRTRGGGPGLHSYMAGHEERSPHTRGWSHS